MTLNEILLVPFDFLDNLTALNYFFIFIFDVAGICTLLYYLFRWLKNKWKDRFDDKNGQ